jgi:hypothetical protein
MHLLNERVMIVATSRRERPECRSARMPADCAVPISFRRSVCIRHTRRGMVESAPPLWM